jgi:hypothetical protein
VPPDGRVQDERINESDYGLSFTPLDVSLDYIVAPRLEVRVRQAFVTVVLDRTARQAVEAKARWIVSQFFQRLEK